MVKRWYFKDYNQGRIRLLPERFIVAKDLKIYNACIHNIHWGIVQLQKGIVYVKDKKHSNSIVYDQVPKVNSDKFIQLALIDADILFEQWIKEGSIIVF